MSQEEVQEFKLDSDCELRFEVESKNEKVTLTLKNGYAEVFGTEMVKGKSYEFTTGAKIAVFSWQGCVLELKGKTDVSYVARETPMVTYLNCHIALENLRNIAEIEQKTGPVVIVVGPCDVGKSTLCKLLLNYAVRMNRRPIFVDVDVGQGQVSVPGTVGALLIERPATIEEGFSDEAPLVYHFGHRSPDKNEVLYNMLVNKLAKKVSERLETNKRTKTSGVIINTCGWVKGIGYQLILNAIRAFEVDIIFVLDQERLYNELVRDVLPFIRVVFLQKSGGVVERNKKTRTEARDSRIREYFYGNKIALYPHSFDVKWSEINLYKIGAPPLPDSCLPLGMKATDHLKKLVLMQPNPTILHHLLAISFAENNEEEIIETNIAGFVCVTNVDVERQTITLLSPQPRPLPNTILLFSDIQFMDIH